MKLLIVDDHDIVRKGLTSALLCEASFEEISEAENIDEAMKVLRMSAPDVTIIDINLGHGQNGLLIVEQAKKEAIETKFIILTSSSRREDFVRAKALGVQGYILKDSSMEDIFYALKVVMKGKYFYDSQIEVVQPASKQEQVKRILTEREYEVLLKLGEGHTNAQMAEELFITENTVKKHISSILSKLELMHRTEAALFAAKLWRRKEDGII